MVASVHDSCSDLPNLKMLLPSYLYSLCRIMLVSRFISHFRRMHTSDLHILLANCVVRTSPTELQALLSMPSREAICELICNNSNGVHLGRLCSC